MTKAKCLLLIMTNEQDIGEMLRLLFEGQGYEVAVEINGRDVVEACVKWQPDVLLLDTRHPGINRYTIENNLREDIRTRRVHVGLVIAGPIPGDIVAMPVQRPDNVFTVPFDFPKLMRFVAKGC